MKPIEDRYQELLDNIRALDQINKDLRTRIQLASEVGPVNGNDTRYILGYNSSYLEIMRILEDDVHQADR